MCPGQLPAPEMSRGLTRKQNLGRAVRRPLPFLSATPEADQKMSSHPWQANQPLKSRTVGIARSCHGSEQKHQMQQKKILRVS